METQVVTPEVRREYARGFMECMRNMAVTATYSGGAGYLVHENTKIFGSVVATFLVAGALMLIAVHGARCTCDIFMASVLRRFPWLWETRLRYGLVMVAILALIFVPLVIMMSK